MFKLFRVIWNLRDLDENVHVIKCRFHYVIDLLERIETIMAKNQDTINKLASDLTRATGEIKSEIEKLKAAQEAGETLDFSALEAAVQGADDVAPAIEQLPSDTPAAAEGQDTLDAGAGADVPATPETPEGQVADQA